jgi:hypothetical protein
MPGKIISWKIRSLHPKILSLKKKEFPDMSNLPIMAGMPLTQVPRAQVPDTQAPDTQVSMTQVSAPQVSTTDKINELIDEALQKKSAESPKRDYLGASRLGVSCSRALQYEYTHTPRDKEWSGRTLRIFEMGHAIEEMALGWLRETGFDIQTHRENGKPFGFSVANGRIQGHVDGIIYAAPHEAGMTYPALWECKSMNAKAWKQTVEKGVRLAKPVYAVQVALYQAYMEEAVAGISENPALFTAVNKDTSEIFHELVPFDAALAQEASDRGVNILRATRAGETGQEFLPRISLDPDHFECRFCDWKERCWQGGL